MFKRHKPGNPNAERTYTHETGEKYPKKKNTVSPNNIKENEMLKMQFNYCNASAWLIKLSL